MNKIDLNPIFKNISIYSNSNCSTHNSFRSLTINLNLILISLIIYITFY